MHSTPEATRADDPAMMIYTSGTTGPPKGALEPHRVLLGHLPGVEFIHEFFPQAGDRMWTPADWAWAGGLLNVLLPSLYYGVPVVARKFDQFDAEEAFALMAQTGVRNAFMPPTALRMMRAAPPPRARHDLRCARSARPARRLGAETYEWAQGRARPRPSTSSTARPSATTSLGSCGALGVSKAGAIGKPVPGHRVAVDRLRRQRAARRRRSAQIAIERPDPVMFLGYWNEPEATAKNSSATG